MTGFGQSQIVIGDITFNIEVRSLNSKFLDLNLRLPKMLSDKEYEIRNLVADLLERGKVSLIVETIKLPTAEQPPQYDEKRFISRYQELKKLADRVLAPYDTLFELALHSPEVELEQKDELTQEELRSFLSALRDALLQCDSFRGTEGSVLQQKCLSYVQNITEGLRKVEMLDPARVDKIRARIRKNVTDFFGEEGFDQNRLEQEIIFYIEKLDIHEERVRLQSHLDFFVVSLSGNISNGKKLGFIAQEIGREINTIGSKANDAAIQKEVVTMKEELEKIKEQLNNIL